MAQQVSIVGAGSVGRTLGRALAQAGYHVAGLSCRSADSARAAREFSGAGEVCESPADAARMADVVFLTVPDSAIRDVCGGIAREGGFRRGQTVLHCSGAVGSDALDAARAQQAVVGALHPIQTFARPAEALKALPGTVYTFEGDDAAFEVARQIVAALDGRLHRISPATKALYHAASVFASNYLVALVQIASDVLAGSGLPRGDVLAALLPLIRGTVDNLDRVGLPDALTGPVARGDAAAVKGHITALEQFDARLVPLYGQLGLRALSIARRKGGVTEEQARRLHGLLQQAAVRSNPT